MNHKATLNSLTALSQYFSRLCVRAVFGSWGREQSQVQSGTSSLSLWNADALLNSQQTLIHQRLSSLYKPPAKASYTSVSQTGPASRGPKQLQNTNYNKTN